MAVFQTLGPQSDGHWNVNLERFDFLLDRFSDTLDLGLLAVFKLADDFVHRFLGIFDDLLKLASVHLLKIIV